MVFSPAGIEFCTIHLFSRGTRVSGGHDRMVFINNDRAEVTPQAGALVRTPCCQIQKIVMPVGSHSKSVWQSPVLKKHGLNCNRLHSTGIWSILSGKENILFLIHEIHENPEKYGNVKYCTYRYKIKFQFPGLMPEHQHRSTGPEGSDKGKKK
jgi:hypothetical protein